MSSAGVRTYNGGLRPEAPPASRGQSPRGESGGKAPWSWQGFCV